MLLVDTNVWFETIDQTNRDYRRCVQALTTHAGQLATPATVVTETAWMIEDRFGPEAETRFLRTVTNPEAVTIIDLTTTDWARAIALVERYASLGLGTVDASIIAIAERLNVTTIATMNHRDFRVVRPAHCDTFELIP